eukprot:2807394-Pyramimonas_sp.AAC.1
MSTFTVLSKSQVLYGFMLLQKSPHRRILQVPRTCVPPTEIPLSSLCGLIDAEAFYTEVFQLETQSLARPTFPKHYPTSCLVGRVKAVTCVSKEDFMQGLNGQLNQPKSSKILASPHMCFASNVHTQPARSLSMLRIANTTGRDKDFQRAWSECAIGGDVRGCGPSGCRCRHTRATHDGGRHRELATGRAVVWIAPPAQRLVRYPCDAMRTAGTNREELAASPLYSLARHTLLVLPYGISCVLVPITMQRQSPSASERFSKSGGK